MRIKAGNRTLDAKDCTSLLSAMRGLMFSHEGVALVRGGGIWMPFVAKSLWLYFLDNALKVISIDYAVPLTLSPETWRVYSCRGASYCLESAEALPVKPGARIKILRNDASKQQ